jgi:hypothetical protein
MTILGVFRGNRIVIVMMVLPSRSIRDRCHVDTLDFMVVAWQLSLATGRKTWGDDGILTRPKAITGPTRVTREYGGAKAAGTLSPAQPPGGASWGIVDRFLRASALLRESLVRGQPHGNRGQDGLYRVGPQRGRP